MDFERTQPMVMALQSAELALMRQEVPVGAVIVHGPTDRVIARAGNQTLQHCDPTAHAEMLVLRAAGRALATARLDACDLYTTLEPCAMCAAAIGMARIRRLYYGASDAKGGAVENGPRWFQQPTCHHAPEVYPGIDAERAAALMRQFFQRRR